MQSSSRWLSACTWPLFVVILLFTSCTDGKGSESDAVPTSDTVSGDTTTDVTASCEGVDEVTSKAYLCYVIHNEEDDSYGDPSSNADIPDYNNDRAVFDHFADAMYDYAQLLAEYDIPLSFQPDWTFTEGVATFRPAFYQDLLALGNVEIVPHAHETVVALDELYDRLVAVDAQPQKIIGGMTFDKYVTKQAWFDANPGYAFWDAPTATEGHVDDKPSPPFIYRIGQPSSVATTGDLYFHRAESPIIVTPGLPSLPAAIVQLKPAERLISPVYVFRATREFVAEADDASVPPGANSPMDRR